MFYVRIVTGPLLDKDDALYFSVLSIRACTQTREIVDVHPIAKCYRRSNSLQSFQVGCGQTRNRHQRRTMCFCCPRSDGGFSSSSDLLKALKLRSAMTVAIPSLVHDTNLLFAERHGLQTTTSVSLRMHCPGEDRLFAKLGKRAHQSIGTSIMSVHKVLVMSLINGNRRTCKVRCVVRDAASTIQQ